jgi:hypothetical protein
VEVSGASDQGIVVVDPRAAAVIPSLTLAPVEPKRRAGKRGKAGSKPAHWPPTAEADAAMRRILGALADARAEAGWEPMRMRPGSPWARKRHGHLALRLWELTAEHGAERAEQMLVAVYRSKVARDAREGGDAAAGTWANATTPLRDASWEPSLAAGLAWLAGGRPAATTDRRGSFVPKSEVTW